MTFARSLFVACALLAAITGCNNDDLPPGAQYTALQGVVVDSATSQPIVGAQVTVDAILVTTTDKDGKFAFDKIPSGEYDYTIDATGYTTYNGTGTAQPGKTVPPLNLKLTAKPSTSSSSSS